MIRAFAEYKINVMPNSPQVIYLNHTERDGNNNTSNINNNMTAKTNNATSEDLIK